MLDCAGYVQLLKYHACNPRFNFACMRKMAFYNFSWAYFALLSNPKFKFLA